MGGVGNVGEMLWCLTDLVLPRAPVERVERRDLLERDADLRFRLAEELFRMVGEVVLVAQTLRSGYLRDVVYPRAIARGMMMIIHLLPEPRGYL